MKKKMGIRTLAAILAASVVVSASAEMVSAKNYGASVSATGDVSDTSSAYESTSRASSKSTSANVALEGAALSGVKVPTGLTGAGTADSPYQIGSLNDLLLMNSYINYESYAYKEFVLTKDIDLSKVTFSNFTESDGVWALVSAKASLSGNANVRFRLNGNGHKLYGMNSSVSKNVSTGAIFGVINANSSIENLNVESCTLRVNSASDGAFAVLAVQNSGTIKNVTMTDCVLDARLGVVAERANDDGNVSGISGRIGVGHAIGVADNSGKVLNFTVTGTDTNKGVFVKGARRYVGAVAGQNRKEIADVTVSGVRILSYGSEDADTSVTGKGEVAEYVGAVVGRNEKSATVTSANVTLKNGGDILFGDVVGGIVGDNAGSVEGSMVVGTNKTGTSVSSASANLYGCGRYGAIAGVNSGSISSSGAYDVGFCFAQGGGQCAYGGVVGANSGSIANCAATGSVNLTNAPAAGVGGLVGMVRSGTLLQGNYVLVSASPKGSSVGAIVGKDGSASYIGQTNFWSSQASGLETPAPNEGAGQNDLSAAKPVIVLTKSTVGVTLNASALAWSWQDGKVTAAADFTKDVTISNPVIRLTKSTNSVSLSCTENGTVGMLSYGVTMTVPAGISGRKLSARVSVPVFATASAANGAGASVKNPVVISDAKQMQIMQYAPNAHYKLAADITLGSDWTPVDFGGTLNGAGHTLRIAKPLFASVSGSRGGSVADADWKYTGSNLISGYIYDMKVVPTACVLGGVFGDVKNATLRDVTYAVTGENDGFVALSGAKSGALIDTLSGSAYLLRCKVSVPVAVTADSADGIGAMVGYAAVSNLIAEDCETSSLISVEKNLAKVGGLFGQLSASGTAELVNCSATGCVYVSQTVSDVRPNIMIGASSGVTAAGCTYAVPFGVEGGSVSKTAAPFKEGIAELNPQSEQAVQGAEDARSMLALIDPELIEDAQVNGLSKEGGVYKLRTANDMLDMMSMLNSGNMSDTAHTSVYELQNDIDMNGAELRMATTADAAFCGTFRSASGHKYTLSNFTVTNTGTDAYDPYGYPEAIYSTAAALFCYASDAQFSDFVLSDVTVVSDGVGTAVLVGFADKYGDVDEYGDYTECSFNNIDIVDCEVNSCFTTDGNGYEAGKAALAGTLIGAVYSANGGDLYTITNITVSSCSVINRNWDEDWEYYTNPGDYTDIGGAWSIGGLIGGSRLEDGTLCIGESGNSASITLENITVVGFGGVGGVIGMAGTSSLINDAGNSPSNLPTAGGLEINGVTVCGKTDGSNVLRSSITAGTVSTTGGSCGGILGIELVNAGEAAIRNCTVSDTDILSDNDLPVGSMTGYATDTGGIAGHMAGLVEYCTVDNCTIKSCVAGGIVGRSSKKGTITAASHNIRSLLTVDHCYVKGGTVIGFDGLVTGTDPQTGEPVRTSNNKSAEAGGIVASARYASVTITNCGVGSTAKVSSPNLLYAGGFIGYANGGNDYYDVIIQNSTMMGTIEITATVANSAVGGALGYSGMNYVKDSDGSVVANLLLQNCAIGGTLKSTGNYCGGVIGTLQSYTSAQTNIKVFQIENCAISASLASTTTYRAKILGFYAGSATYITTQATRWMGTNNIKRALKDTIVSSYPEDIEFFGYYKNGTNYPLLGSKATTLTNASLISAGCIEDINMPGGSYLDGESAAKVLDGNNAVRSFNVAITNPPVSTLITFDDSDGAGANTEKKYKGWVSSNLGGNPVNNYFEVASTTTTTSIDINAKLDSTGVGLKGCYSVTGRVDPDTSETAKLLVYIPLTLTQIPPPGLEGNGSAANPWQIWDLTQLNSLSDRDLTKNASSSGTDKGYYILMDDIDASGEGFKPIKDKNHANGPFMGTFDGNNHTISGITISGEDAVMTGLFHSTQGATIQDLTISGADVTATGLYASALVGVAVETTFENITIEDSTVGGASDAYPSAYAGAVAAYVTDSTAENIILSGNTVHYAYFTGGVYGHAHYSGATGKSNVIYDVDASDLTVASTTLDTTTAYDGTNTGKIDAAGGIVAEFAGTISANMYSNALAGTISVTGSNAGGAVGIVDRTLTTAASACNVSDVTIGDGTNTVTISSSRTLANKAAAGGIVAKVGSDDPANGAATSPAVTVTLNNCTVNKLVSVSAMLNAGGILGHSSVTGASSPIAITSCDSFANVSEVLPDTTLNNEFTTTNYVRPGVGAIAGRVYDLKHFTVNLCVASGTLTGVTNVGGVVGSVPISAGNDVPAVEATDGTRISNTVFSATLNTTGTDAKKGVLFGSVASYQMPANLGTTPFVNIYYSSYQVPSDIQISGDNAYDNYQATYIDLMTNFAYSADGTNYSTTLRVPQAGTTLSTSQTGANSVRLWSGASGNYDSFTCPSDVAFILDTVDSSLVTFNKSTRKLSPRPAVNDSGDGVFRYQNGLELKLNLLVSDIKGDGTAQSPYLIERIGHLNALKTMPDKVFVLAADIDFSSNTTAHGEALTPAEVAWAGNWDSWATALLRTNKESGAYIYRFTGSLDGKWYPYDSTTGTYDTTQPKGDAHTISNLTVSTAGIAGSAYVEEFSGAGLFPVIETGASVSNIKFSNCSFTATSTSAVSSNVGVLAGVNKGTVSHVEADQCTLTSSQIKTNAQSVEVQAHHVGAIAGISYGALSYCDVKNSTVTSSHCAGGVVGGGGSVSYSNVSNTTVTGREYAGGIAGGNLNYASNVTTEVPNDQKQAMQTCSFSYCNVWSCTIASQASKTTSSVGGILGIAESGDNSEYGYRSVSIDHCTVDCVTGTHKPDSSKHTTIRACADSTVTSAQENFAGGMIGQVVDYYDGIVVENCASYAEVTAQGDYRNGNSKTSASALVGRVQEAQHFKAYVNNTVKFRFINNVCGGKLSSPYIAGGVCGLFGPISTGYTIPEDAVFACGNIISASYNLLPENRNGVTTNNNNSDGFGVFMGLCMDDAFDADAAPSTMTDNYYSSYVCKYGITDVPAFSVSRGDVHACAELYDVAAYSEGTGASATKYKSSFLVKNHSYTEVDGSWQMVEADSFADSVTAPEYYDSVNDANVYPANYSMKMQLKFNLTESTYSVDFANPANTLTVYGTAQGVAAGDVHTLSLTETTDIFVDPSGSNEFYSAERAVSTSDGNNMAKLSIHKDPADCAMAYRLVANLDYGLLVGVTIKTPSGTGEEGDPFKIPDAATFAHYFYRRDAVMDDDRLYLQYYYAQTGDIDFDDVLKIIAGNDTENYPPYAEGEVYGYRNGSSFVQGTFVPIGTETAPFIGGYNGGWTERNQENGVGHTITNFHYTAPAGMTDVGLFGYVGDPGVLKNIHIELAETALDSDLVTPDSTAAGIFGGLNTGGLVGRYVSSKTIENCSVVYGTVRSNENGANVGGLVGTMQGTATLQNCFTSTNVRILETLRLPDNLTGLTYENYTCGGLVGFQESGDEISPLPCRYENCFCSSDVVGPYFVGGFVGKVGLMTHIELVNCASTATVTGLYQIIASANTNAVPLVVGYKPASDGTAIYNEANDDDPRYVYAENVYVAGMNTTEFRRRGSSASGEQYYPALFGLRPLLANSTGIFYDASVVGRLTVPNGSAAPDILLLSGEMRSRSNGTTSNVSPYTTMNTKQMTSAYDSTNAESVGPALGNAFDTHDEALYPVLQMKNRGASGQKAKDPYFEVFATLSALPMHTDARELDDISADRTYAGVTYPTSVSKTLGTSTEAVLDENDQVVTPAYTAPALTIVSSKYSVGSDTVPYDADYDHLLTGNGGRTDMQTDLLFDRNGEDSYSILRNTNLTSDRQTTSGSGSSYPGMQYSRNERSPFVRVSGTLKGYDIHRTIHIGLRSTFNTSYVTTERQLRAITAPTPEAGGKFAVYANTISNTKNIRVCADIEFNPDPVNPDYPPFTPIIGFQGTSAGDQDEGAFGFDGSNCEIRNMTIARRQNAGMFDSITGDTGTPKIQNVILRNPTVSGSSTCGALVGLVNHTNAMIKNCSVIGGTLTATQQNVSVGGLVGSFASNQKQDVIDVQWIGVSGVKIVTATSAVNNPATNVGLMFGSVSGAKISNVYAVGEAIVNATNVGGLAGSATNCSVNGAVTSGYLCSTNTGNAVNVGGMFGRMIQGSGNVMLLNNMVTTAFVTGGVNYAGIVGQASGGTIGNAIFAGSTSGVDGDAICVYASGNLATASYNNRKTICYDVSLQRTDLESEYNPMTTWDIVCGNNMPFDTGSSFEYDTLTHRYYPNPVDTEGYAATYGSISNLITDSFKTGLSFALARVNMVYAGTGGSISEYDQITATSPININVFDNDLSNDKCNSADIVTLEEYSADNSVLMNGNNEGYLRAVGDSLEPHIWAPNAFTGVRATLSSGEDATFKDVEGNYRFVIVQACRMAEIEYTVLYDTTAAALEPAVTGDEETDPRFDKAVLMLKSQQQITSLYDTDDSTVTVPTQTFSSNAVTSKYQDTDTSTGNDFAVRYRKIAVPADGRIYIGTMLPSQYKVSGVTAYEWDHTNDAYGTTDIYDSTNKYAQLDTTTVASANTKVKINVTVTADPGWGLRDLDGGIG